MEEPQRLVEFRPLHSVGNGRFHLGQCRLVGLFVGPGLANARQSQRQYLGRNGRVRGRFDTIVGGPARRSAGRQTGQVQGGAVGWYPHAGHDCLDRLGTGDVHMNAEHSTTSARRGYVALVVALAFWGVISGISFGPSQALFADSIPKGKRSELLTYLYSFYLISSAVGPIVSIVLIMTVSEQAQDWSVAEIFPVFLAGVLLEIPAAIVMLFFSDKHVVLEEDASEQGDEPEATTHEDGSPNQGPSDGCELEQSLLEAPTEIVVSNYKWYTKAIIPYVLFVSSLVTSLASGASVKYFPLFFKEVGFGAAEVQFIFLLVPIFISALSFVSQRVGKRFGRIETTFSFSCVGVTLLFLMNWLSRTVTKESEQSLWNDRPHLAILIVVVYLFRTGIMNCTYPLLESILMDNVPSNQRARWKSLESIASFGWTGRHF